MLKFLLLIVSLSFFFALAAPQKICAQNKTVTVTTERIEHSVKVTAYNDNPYSITLTVNIKGKNIKPGKKRPVRLVMLPKSSKPVVEVSSKNESKALKISLSYKWIVGNINATHNDAYVYRLPYRNNNRFMVGQSYNGSFSHKGSWKYAVDFMMPVGTPVVAARAGIVARIQQKYSKGGTAEEFKDKANYIFIEHDDGSFGEYAHLKQNGVLVSPGTRVQQGQVIGISGNTGYSSGPHLHFSVSKVVSEGSFQSIPVKIKTTGGILLKLQKGKEYMAQ